MVESFSSMMFGHSVLKSKYNSIESLAQAVSSEGRSHKSSMESYELAPADHHRDDDTLRQSDMLAEQSSSFTNLNLEENPTSNKIQNKPTSKEFTGEISKRWIMKTATSSRSQPVRSNWPGFKSVLLPLILVFLLPSVKFSRLANQQLEQHTNDQIYKLVPPLPSDLRWPMRIISAIMMQFMSLPVERFHLSQGHHLVMAKELGGSMDPIDRIDLQEEETQGVAYGTTERNYAPGHSVIMARSSAVGGPGRDAYGPPNEPLAAAADYLGADQIEPGPEGPQADTAPSAPAHLTHPSGGSGTMQSRSDLPAVRALNVKCEKNHMTVNIVFDRPFYGMVFSKGHYNDQKCVHLPANSGQSSVNFDIHLGKCGMSSSDNPNALQLSHQQASQQAQQQQPNGLYIENTIIIQYDPQVQEIYDQARKLRCTWYDYYEKSVSFRPYNVDMLDAVTANFLGDNIQCWMQIQVGKGPYLSEVAGIVKIGQMMTMVLAIKDDEDKFDMLVRNCVAHDGKHQPIQLVDEFGCVARPKIMSKFQKVRKSGPQATVLSYAYFQAFKFPDSMSVHFQCVIQVCRYECPEPVCQGPAEIGSSNGASPAPQSPPTDYTASGTEIVASKESLPALHQAYYMPPTATNSNRTRVHQQAQQAGNSVHLKMNEGQGRVQVKLDTSIMAGPNQHLQLQGESFQIPMSMSEAQLGPAPLPAGYMTVGTGNRPAHHYRATGGGQTGSIPRQTQIFQTSQAGGATNGRPPVSQSARPSLAPSSHRATSAPGALFSSPFLPQSQQTMISPGGPRINALFTNRMGEEVVPSTDMEKIQETASMEVKNMELASGVQPLSLIGVPRGFKTSLRQRRSVNDSQPRELELGVRPSRHAPEQDSTSVRTQKTIQVVSSDDVAFNLASDGSPVDDMFRDPDSPAQRKRLESLSRVCVSPGGLVVAILMTVLVVGASLGLAAFLVLRQRALMADVQAEVEAEKLGERLAQGGYGVQAHCHLGQHSESPSVDYDNLLRRQQVEMQQRNNYLARLYSQFMPASYWR